MTTTAEDRGGFNRADMKVAGSRASSLPEEVGFSHEALFYADEGEFVTGATNFLREGVCAGEPSLVVVNARKIDLLRKELEADTDTVLFADMEDVGANPARIIPAWADFVSSHKGRRLRGIGEPIWAGRSSAELVECQRHESLLNVAFAGSSGFALLCPYDTTSLGPDVIDEARRSHPFIRDDGSLTTSDDYLGIEKLGSPFATPLPPPPSSFVDCRFQGESLGGLRSLVLREAMGAGLGEAHAENAVIAVNEVASNSLVHANGWGVLRTWQTPDAFICEVSDDGHISEPLVGRIRPGFERSGGRGLWMVNQLCDLVQVRSLSTGTNVRMHFRRRSAR